MKKCLIVAAMMMSAMAVSAQTNKSAGEYLVKTKSASETEKGVAEKQESNETVVFSNAVDFISQHFRYIPLRNWTEGMRFMVIPDKKDLIIKTFIDSAENKMANNAELRHKILTYRGHVKNGNEVHERIRFVDEESGKTYFFAIPTLSYTDYCNTPDGIPTLAYLGDVDAACEQLMGKTLITTTREYFVDTNDGGYDIVTVPEDMEVKVKAVGVGTRSFPVKIVVADKKGNEFYQNVAISRTNSGLSDEDFLQSAIVPHTFYGSFELNESPATEYYKKYIGKDVYNLVNTPMLDSLTNNYTTLIRLSTFTVKKVRTVRGTNKIRLTLEGHRSHRPYSKDVEILTTNQAGNVIGNEDQTFDKIFALGDPSNMKDVRSENLNDLMKGAVKRNFTEAEVRLALGEPTGYSQLSDKEYTWNYNQPGTEYKTVIFDKKTRLVKSFQIF